MQNNLGNPTGPPNERLVPEVGDSVGAAVAVQGAAVDTAGHASWPVSHWKARTMPWSVTDIQVCSSHVCELRLLTA